MEKKTWDHLKYEKTTPQKYLHLSFEILGGVLWGFVDDLVNIRHIPGRQEKRKLKEIWNKVRFVRASVPKSSKMTRLKLASSSNNNEVQVLWRALGQIKKNHCVLLYNQLLSSDYSYYDLHNCGTQYFRWKSSFTVTIKLIKRFRFKV